MLAALKVKYDPEDIRECWKQGRLKYKLLDHSFTTYDRIWEAMDRLKVNPTLPRKMVLHKARRTAKSYEFGVIALEVCLRKPNARVRYGASTAKSVRNFIRPIIDRLIEDAPEEYRPEWMTFDGYYRFPNGSQLHVVGVNNGHENDLRGPESDLAIMDEAAFVDNLTYVVDSVLMPQLISTNGFCLVGSSSPETPAHDFVSYIEMARSEGMYISATIYDAQYTPAQIQSFCKEAGGETSTFWRREYLNQIIVDESRAIVPEWKEMFVQSWEPDEWNKFYHRYESMDLGIVEDKTAVLFGYYDFKKAKFYVENELTIKGPALTTEVLKAVLLDKEAETFKGIKPYRRISDNNNPMLLQDLGHLHGIHFNATNKDELHAMVNELRVFVVSGRLIINPRCKELIGCLSTGIWDSLRRGFDRSKAYGHYDCLAALVYLIRNLDQNTNPIPENYGMGEDYYIPAEMMKSRSEQELLKIFKVVR